MLLIKLACQWKEPSLVVTATNSNQGITDHTIQVDLTDLKASVEIKHFYDMFGIILATGRLNDFQIWKPMFKEITNHYYSLVQPLHTEMAHRGAFTDYYVATHTKFLACMLQGFYKIL